MHTATKQQQTSAHQGERSYALISDQANEAGQQTKPTARMTFHNCHRHCKASQDVTPTRHNSHALSTKRKQLLTNQAASSYTYPILHVLSHN